MINPSIFIIFIYHFLFQLLFICIVFPFFKKKLIWKIDSVNKRIPTLKHYFFFILIFNHLCHLTHNNLFSFFLFSFFFFLFFLPSSHHVILPSSQSRGAAVCASPLSAEQLIGAFADPPSCELQQNQPRGGGHQEVLMLERYQGINKSTE